MEDEQLDDYEEDAEHNMKEQEEDTKRKASELAKAAQEPAPSENKRARESSDFDKDAQMEIDARSIYVGNVEYQSCGTVQRVTIPGDRMQHPKGYAYVEFLEAEAVENALKLENSEVGGRQIKIARKRTNEAGVARGGRGGRGARGRGRGRGGRFPMLPMPMMFDPSMMMPGYSPYGGFRGGRGGRGRGRGRRASVEQ